MINIIMFIKECTKKDNHQYKGFIHPNISNISFTLGDSFSVLTLHNQILWSDQSGITILY